MPKSWVFMSEASKVSLTGASLANKKFMRMWDKSPEGHTYSFKFYCKTSTFSAHVPRLGAIGRIDVRCSKDAHTLLENELHTDASIHLC